MKNLILLLLLTAFSNIMLAQYKENAFLLELNGSYSVRNSETQNLLNSTFSSPPFEYTQSQRQKERGLSFNAGYLFNDKYVIGVSYSYRNIRADYKSLTPSFIFNPAGGGSGQSVEESRKTTSSNIAYGAFARYFFKMSNRFYFTPTLSFAFLKSSYEREVQSNGVAVSSDSDAYDQNYFNANLSGTLIYRVNNWFGVQAKVIDTVLSKKYNDSRYTSKNNFKETNFDFNFNPVYWEYGVLFFLGK